MLVRSSAARDVLATSTGTDSGPVANRSHILVSPLFLLPLWPIRGACVSSIGQYRAIYVQPSNIGNLNGSDPLTNSISPLKHSPFTEGSFVVASRLIKSGNMVQCLHQRTVFFG
jgi:hypothetical protein